MNRALLVASSWCADGLLGDPRQLPHPVRGIGACIAVGERLARTFARGSERGELCAGYALCGAIVGATYLAADVAIEAVRSRDSRAASVLEIALGWTTLAARDLLAETHAVATALEAGDLPLARERVARIVGRDTMDLDASEIARAAVETLAESACDGIVAPLVALALGGAPLALAFKAASTLDSMIGHPEPPYGNLGFASAKLDDVLCWLPARITALALAYCAPAVGGDARRALAVLRADGDKHRSPNAGRPEAAMAGALAVRLGGTNRYDGVAINAPHLGAAFASPHVADVRRAMRLVAIASSLVAASLVAATSLGRTSRGAA